MNTQSNKRSRLGLVASISWVLILGGAGWVLYLLAHDDFEADTAIVAELAPQPMPVGPPDLPTLAAAAMRGGSVGPLSAAALEEEKSLKDQQVEAAAEMLRNVDASTRAVGAEQLSAYPTEAAEEHLVNAILSDVDAGVRAAAAQSLMSFKKPREGSVDALLRCLQDADPAVRRNALNTLRSYASHEGDGLTRTQRIFDKLDELAAAKRLAPETQAAVHNYLLDQAPRRVRLAQ
jgi:hypothetical protein